MQKAGFLMAWLKYEYDSGHHILHPSIEILTKFSHQNLMPRHSLDSTIPSFPKSEISSLEPSSVVVQPGLCRTWSETPKTGFLVSQLTLMLIKEYRSLIYI